MGYLIAGNHTHFEYDEAKQTAWCTHGDWGGSVTLRDDGTCRVEQVEYHKYVLTDCRSFGDAVEAGLIIWR